MLLWATWNLMTGSGITTTQSKVIIIWSYILHLESQVMTYITVQLVQ